MKKTYIDNQYWNENYAEPDLMDGVYNAKEHLIYIKSIFDLEEVTIKSIVDLGFGLGHIFEQIPHYLKPYKLVGVEPSLSAFNQVSIKSEVLQGIKFRLYNETIQDWIGRKDRFNQQFDLGICNSVLQYLCDDELSETLDGLAQKVKYLYLSIPTNIEYKRQREEFGFVDQYAYKRSKSFYMKLLKKNYTIVSSRLLESKVYFDDRSSNFSEYLFRL